MKNLATILVVCALTFLTYSTKAQDVIRQQACDDPSIFRQVDSIKNLMTSKGFIVVKEASMAMISEYEMPVVVPLRAGTWYQFIFIGDISSRLYEVRMYDYEERQVNYVKKMWGDVDGNVISIDYIPKVTEYHMIKPVQVNKKKKNVCGYVMLLKKVQL